MPMQAACCHNLQCLSMNLRKIILRTVSVVLSSLGILLSLLAMFIQTLVPSVSRMVWSKPPPNARENSQRTISRCFKRPITEPAASPASSPLQSTRSNNLIRSSIVDGAVPQSHADADVPASPMHTTESPIQRSNRGEVSEAHKVFKRHTLSVSSFNACRAMVSPKQRLMHLKGRNSMGSLSSLKNPDPPLRTQPYAAPYFFPAPGTPEAIDYVTKTREELLRPSGFMHTSFKRNKTNDLLR